MNFDPVTFKVLVEYPDKKKIREQVEQLISQGRKAFSQFELLDTKTAIDEAVRKMFNEQKAFYNEAQREANNAFRESLKKQYGNSKFSEAVENVVWSRSWQDGHSGGYGDIENQYIKNVEFAEQILGIFQGY